MDTEDIRELLSQFFKIACQSREVPFEALMGVLQAAKNALQETAYGETIPSDVSQKADDTVRWVAQTLEAAESGAPDFVREKLFASVPGNSMPCCVREEYLRAITPLLERLFFLDELLAHLDLIPIESEDDDEEERVEKYSAMLEVAAAIGTAYEREIGAGVLPQMDRLIRDMSSECDEDIDIEDLESHADLSSVISQESLDELYEVLKQRCLYEQFERIGGRTLDPFYQMSVIQTLLTGGRLPALPGDQGEPPELAAPGVERRPTSLPRAESASESKGFKPLTRRGAAPKGLSEDDDESGVKWEPPTGYSLLEGDE